MPGKLMLLTISSEKSKVKIKNHVLAMLISKRRSQ